jgi:RNA polymerase sigma factor (sigma-70 family)
MTPLAKICDPDWISSAAIRLGVSIHDMQDIAQIAASKYLLQQRRGAIRHPSAYLDQVIRRTIIDEARAAARQPMSREVMASDRLLRRGAQRDPIDTSDVLAERLDLQVIIERLPQKQRDVLRRSLDGESIRDIAKKEGVPEETVRRRRHRAALAVRRELMDEDTPPKPSSGTTQTM